MSTSSLSQYKDIITKLDETYKLGHDSGEILFFPSTKSTHQEEGVDFEIRLCPSLAHKAPPSGQEKPKEEVNPFLPPYKPGLYIGNVTEGDEEYVALMNKFSVAEKHFLFVTKEYKPQTSPLNPDDLLAAYKVLAAAKQSGRPYFMFYNCGLASGSSQKHKHMQFMPLEEADGPPIERLARQQALETEAKAFWVKTLPYSHFIMRLPPYSSSRRDPEMLDVLSYAFITLLDLVMQSFRLQNDLPPGPPAYNVILTLEHLYLIPRRQEDFFFKNGKKLGLNALGFAGMLLVKSEEDEAALKEERVFTVLRAVGLEDLQGESCSKVESSLTDD